MIYYKDDLNGEVYAYYQTDIGSGFVRDGLRVMTEAEIKAHLNPIPVYWTEGNTLVLAAYGADGWWEASDDEITALLPLVRLNDAEQKARGFRIVADSAIAPLQDAVDLEEATEAEAAELKAWKKYRIALIRVPDQPGYPETFVWPAPPA